MSILPTPRPPFSGVFRVILMGKLCLVKVREDIVVSAPRRVGYLNGLTMDQMMQMVASKGGRIGWP